MSAKFYKHLKQKLEVSSICERQSQASLFYFKNPSHNNIFFSNNQKARSTKLLILRI